MGQSKVNEECNEYELGYRFKEKYWRKGFASESSEAIMKHGFSLKEVNKIVAIALKTNIGSTGVMKKIGMEFEKEDYLYNEDVVVYSISRANVKRIKK